MSSSARIQINKRFAKYLSFPLYIKIEKPVFLKFTPKLSGKKRHAFIPSGRIKAASTAVFGRNDRQ